MDTAPALMGRVVICTRDNDTTLTIVGASDSVKGAEKQLGDLWTGAPLSVLIFNQVDTVIRPPERTPRGVISKGITFGKKYGPLSDEQKKARAAKRRANKRHSG